MVLWLMYGNVPHVPRQVALGCAFLLLYNAAVAVVGLANKGIIPARFYLFARAW